MAPQFDGFRERREWRRMFLKEAVRSSKWKMKGIDKDSQADKMVSIFTRVKEIRQKLRGETDFVLRPGDQFPNGI
jgi:hypothetical protein